MMCHDNGVSERGAKEIIQKRQHQQQQTMDQYEYDYSAFKWCTAMNATTLTIHIIFYLVKAGTSILASFIVDARLLSPFTANSKRTYKSNAIL